MQLAAWNQIGAARPVNRPLLLRKKYGNLSFNFVIF